MAIDLKDEILQDFLVEGGEILELLGEQLVDLESRPEDRELLNAVFRGFHTIKGGAGFLGIKGMVEVCHCAEDTFNLLRQGSRTVTPEIMDNMLEVLDLLNEMFADMRRGAEPARASDALLVRLHKMSEGENSGAAPGGENSTQGESEPVEEFGELLSSLDEAQVESAQSTSEQIAESEDISADEFEHLLDELHGAGSGPSSEASKAVDPAPGAEPTRSPGADKDDITEDEFDALLDELHGAGKGPDQAPAPAEVDRETQTPAQPPAPAPATKASPPESTVRVDTGVLNRIMNMVGELVLVRNRLSTLESAHADEEMANAIGNLVVVTTDLQAAAMRTRMQPVRKVFGRFPRLVRDLARSLGKEVDLLMQGEETELDKNLVDALADPMVHLVRNAVDHGMESPDERAAAGKDRKGTVTLSAEQQGDQILLMVVDDGGGMDAGHLRRKAVEKGLMSEDAAQRLDDQACYNLIFAPGFSTKGEISDVSGRGVGMDVVKSRISELNGNVQIDSEPGHGTRIIIKVPLTLAIVPTLMVKLAEQVFALPLMNVKEVFELEGQQTNVVDGQLTLQVRGKPLPLYYLGEWLVGAAESNGHVVVMHVGTRMVAFVVDHLIGQEEVVIKPLGALLQGTEGLAGATITGDGRIALILDVSELITRHAHAA